MKEISIRKTFFVLTVVFCVGLLFPLSGAAQRRDYLTEAEIELIRDAQEIDLRIEVLSKAIDRRFLVLKNETPSKKAKESEKWGELPKGTRLDLLGDIDKILQKAIDDIDDVAARNKENKLFPKAVFKLTDACQLYLPQFKTFLDKVSDERERGSILGSVDKCNQVIEASAKVPKETTAEDNKKKKN